MAMKILVSGLVGAAVGTLTITSDKLETIPGVAVGVAVACVLYLLLLLTTSNPPKDRETTSQKEVQVEGANQDTTKEKAKKKKKKKTASQKKAEAPSSPPAKSESDKEEDEEDEKKLSKTQLRRQRIRKKKEAAEAAADAAAVKATEEAEKKRIQEKVAKEAAKKAAQQLEAENRAKKQFKAAEKEGGWETQKTKERKEKKTAVKPLDAPRERKEDKAAAGPTIERFKATVDVPKHLIGAVVGRGGVNIQAITAKTGVRITTPKEEIPGPVLIEGADEKGVKAAKRAIEDILKTGTSSITHPGSTTNKVQLTDSKQIGSIIGKEGAHIIALQKELKVTIKMPDRNAVKLAVTVTGPKEQVKLAKEAIEDLIYLRYSKVTHPEFKTLEVSYPSESFGRLIGPRGQNLKSIHGNTKCQVVVPQSDSPHYKPNTVIIVGPAAKLESAKKQVLNTLAQKERYYEEDRGDPNDPNYEEPEDDYY